jgi:DNA-directed RNA polymerase specialized sigma24 family protein
MTVTKAHSLTEHQSLHQRLMEGDPTAPNDVAVALIEPLIDWLTVHNPSLHHDLISEAAEDAILTLIRNPATYDPKKGELEPYLRMSAQGDLRNLLRREAKHRTGHIPLDAVEHSDEAGNYLGRDDDPSFRMQIEEVLGGLGSAVPPSVQQGLTAPEARFLELMLRGERKTDAYAEACGVADRPPEERRRIVKQVKDRLKKRVERAGRNDEHPS